LNNLLCTHNVAAKSASSMEEDMQMGDRNKKWRSKWKKKKKRRALNNPSQRQSQNEAIRQLATNKKDTIFHH